MATEATQIDYSQPPAVQDALGHVLTNGKFQCTRMDRHGAVTGHACGRVMKNKKGSIDSHFNKLHNPRSKYAASQSSYAKAHGLSPLRCDRPRLDGKGWCNCERSGQHSLVAHARDAHKFRGNSASLSTPWLGLNDAQQAYYLERVDLEVRRQNNGGVYTPEDEALNKQLEMQKFPNA
ncbi:hypothetical protein F5X97DRAFT_62136 [Nemania serpens]|nr:hypothetical protein F5X97DRAFT_62136 [Nemania serpens]